VVNLEGRTAGDGSRQCICSAMPCKPVVLDLLVAADQAVVGRRRLAAEVGGSHRVVAAAAGEGNPAAAGPS
jgi:hypothetical protein